MVPAGDIIVDIGVGPLTGVHVEDDDVVVLGLRVPATVRVELVIESKNGVSTTALGERCLGNNGLVLGPGLSLDIERVDIAEGNTGVVKTAVTAVDPELAVVMASTSISSRWGSIKSRLLVDGNGLVTDTTRPAIVLNFEPPAVVKSLGGASVTAIDEHTVKFGCS